MIPYSSSYLTWWKLRSHCHCSATAVSLISVEISGFSREEEDCGESGVSLPFPSCLWSQNRGCVAATQALFALLAAFAAAFGWLFRTLTQITQAGRKRKRSLAGTSAPSFGEDSWWEELKNHLGDQFFHGNFDNLQHKALCMGDISKLGVESWSFTQWLIDDGVILLST